MGPEVEYVNKTFNGSKSSTRKSSLESDDDFPLDDTNDVEEEFDEDAAEVTFVKPRTFPKGSGTRRLQEGEKTKTLEENSSKADRKRKVIESFHNDEDDEEEVSNNRIMLAMTRNLEAKTEAIKLKTHLRKNNKQK